MKLAPPTADVTVIIVTYRSRRYIERCLAALQAQTVTPREVFLIENGSPGDEAVTPDIVPPGVRYIRNAVNSGFAGANNQAAKLASSAWLALLNPDAFAEPDWLERLLDASERWPGADLFGSTQMVADNPGMLDGAGDVYHFTGMPYRGGYGQKLKGPAPEGEIFGPCAAAALIRRETFAALGGFDEAFFCYCEDVDLAFRARLAGYRAIQVGDAIVHHVGYGSSGRWSEFAMYHGVRNRFWTFVKGAPGPLIWLLAPGHIAATLLQGVGALRRRRFSIYARALGDALKDLKRVLAQRRAIQAARTASLMEMVRAMNWDMTQLYRRTPYVRGRAWRADDAD